MSIRPVPQDLQWGAEFSPLATAPVSASPAEVPSEETQTPGSEHLGAAPGAERSLGSFFQKFSISNPERDRGTYTPRQDVFSLLRGLPDLKLWVYFSLNPESTRSHF